MQISPLQLSAFWIGRVHIEPAAPESFVPNAQITIDTTPVYRRSADDPRQWLVDLRVGFRPAGDRKIAYEGFVEMTGAFVVIGEFPEEKQIQVVAINAPSILYSSIREFVAMLTAHGQHGKLILPSVSFIDQQVQFPQSGEKKAGSQSNKPAAP